MTGSFISGALAFTLGLAFTATAMVAVDHGISRVAVLAGLVVVTLLIALLRAPAR